MTIFKFVGYPAVLDVLPRKLAARRARNLLESARRLLADKRPAEALEAYQKAESILPLPTSALSDVVGILAQAKRFDDAAPYAQLLLRDHPLNRRALRALAQTSEVGLDVLAGWRELAQATPQEVEPWLQIARIALRLQDFTVAIEAAERVLSLAPHHSGAERIIVSATRAESRRIRSKLEEAEADAEKADHRLEMIDRALREGDNSTAAVLLGSEVSHPNPGFNQRKRLLRAMLAADAFSAEASGDLAAARLSYWSLKEVAPDAPDYADGLDRCFLADASSASPGAEEDILPTREAPGVVDVVIEERLGQAQSLARSGQLSAAKDQWRGVQPMVRSAPLRRQSQSILAELHDKVLEQLIVAKDAGDSPTAWGLVDILKGLDKDLEAQSAAISLLPQTLKMVRTLPAEETPLIIQLSRRYLAHRSDPAISTRLAKALMKEGRHGEALSIWEGLVVQKPDQIGYWLQIARSARRLHRPDVEQAAIERLLDLNGDHVEGLRLAARFGLPAKGASVCAE